MRVYTAAGDPESGIVTVYDADEAYDAIRTGYGDIITDFSTRQGDVIDLSGIDANTGTRADQDFDLIGAAAFSGTAGELRVWSSKGHTFVAGDVSGDGIADFRLTVDGTYRLADTDFLL